MAEHAPKTMQGLIVPIACSLWAEESGEYNAGGAQLSEIECASPVAGDPEPGQPTDFKLRASGEQSAAAKARTVRQGLPVLDEAGLLFGPAADLDVDLRGCELPSVPLRYEPLQYGGQQTSPHIVRCDDDSLVQVFWKIGVGIQVQTRAVKGTWSAAQTVVTYVAGTNPWPCLLALPNGRVRLYYWTASGTDWQVGTEVSSNRGATWTAGQPVLVEALDATTLTSVERLRVAYENGGTLLVAHVVENDTGAGTVYRDRLVHWVSSDGGGLFRHVATQDGASEDRAGGYHDIAVVDGQFVVASLRWLAGPNTVVATINRLSSARMALATAGELSNTSALSAGQYLGLRTGGGGADYLLADGDLALWLDDDGALYLALRRCHTGSGAPGIQSCPLLRSPNRGQNWTATGDSGVYASRGQVWYWSDTATTYPYRFAAVAQRGRTVLVGDHYRTVGGLQNHISAWYLGGLQNRTMPADGGQLVPTRRVAFDFPQVAIESPDGQGWVLAVVGAPSHAIANGREAITTAAGESVSYSRTGALTSTANGAIFETAFEVLSGTFYMRIYTHDAGPLLRYASEVRITPTTVELWDIHGAKIGATWNRTASGRLRIRLDQKGQDVEATIFEGNSTSEDRKWVVVALGAALVNGGAYAADTIEMFVGASSSVQLDEWPLVYGTYCGDHTIDQDLRSRFPRSVIPSGVWGTSGVRFSSITGPTEVGDTWVIPRSWQYPPQAILPRVSASPRTGMQTRPFSEMDPTTTEVRVAFKIDTTESYPHGRVFGFYIDEANSAQMGLRLWYGGAWHTVGTTQFIEILAAARRGVSMRVTTSGPSLAPVVRRGELVGALVELVSGGPVSDHQARCVGNDRGYVDTSSGVSYPLTLRVDAYVGAGAPANAPSVRVWPKRHLVLVHLADYQEDFLAWQIVTPVQVGAAPYSSPGPAPEGFVKLGLVAAGPVVFLGTQYSNGRRISVKSGTTLTTTRDGTRIPDVEAPARQSASLTWSKPVPTRGWQDTPAPDHLTAKAAGPPVGFRYDTPIDLGDVIVEIDGARVPVVLLSNIERGGVGGLDHWARAALYGRIVSESVDVDAVIGTELVNESLRVQGFDIEGET